MTNKKAGDRDRFSSGVTNKKSGRSGTQILFGSDKQKGVTAIIRLRGLLKGTFSTLLDPEVVAAHRKGAYYVQ